MKNSERPLRALRRTTPRLMRLEPRFMFDGAAVAASCVLARETESTFTNHLFSPEREKLGRKVFGRRQAPPYSGRSS